MRLREVPVRAASPGNLCVLSQVCQQARVPTGWGASAVSPRRCPQPLVSAQERGRCPHGPIRPSGPQCSCPSPRCWAVWVRGAAGTWCQGPDAALVFPKVRQSLQETVCSFKVTNEELAARGPSSDQDVAACDAACKVSPGMGWDVPGIPV